MFGKRKNTTSATGPARTVSLIKDPSGAPAVDLEKLDTGGTVSLVKRARKAGVSLSKRDLAGIRAQAVLVLDHSGSMYGDYDSGAVQTLVERALGFALQIDVDGEIPVIAFDSRVWPAVTVDATNYSGVVDRELWHPAQMGSTDMASALRAVQAMAEKTDAPLFAVVITDGEPNSRSDTTSVVCELARYPVFVKFLAVQPVTYLQELDDLDDSARLLDNVDAKFLQDAAGMSDLAFADAMVDEWDTWIAAATNAGILR
jgi:Mg-chelatase subunit ChlD